MLTQNFVRIVELLLQALKRSKLENKESWEERSWAYSESTHFVRGSITLPFSGITHFVRESSLYPFQRIQTSQSEVSLSGRPPVLGTSVD